MNLFGFYTQQGEALSAALHSGTALQYTRAAAGDGNTPLSAAAMASERQALPISTPRRSGGTVLVPVTLTEALAEEGYSLREVGLYALDEEGEEILYRLFRLSEPVTVTADGTLTIRMDLKETVSESAEVTVIGTPAGILTEEDLGAANGAAALDAGGKVPVSQLPYTCGTEELETGVTPLETGHLHFVYAE